MRLTPGRPAGAAAALLVLAVALAGCTSAEVPPGTASPTTSAATSSAPAGPAVAGEPVRLVSATLEDTVVPADDGRISWTTTWRACFAPAEGSPAELARWEARLVTPEGASPQLEVLPDGCVDLEVATGVNPADRGLLNREIQLSDAAGLAYRVRAVGADGTATPWTGPVRVTSQTPA
ncbi:hypothetical protein JOD57_000435 [Geodermatophilus bullaregiensis]|uniref:hypothetical protein n=1 Tax=Geodermatophilus bullaregiensis TaxID=1564160 RepID=UPI00195BAE81|nr:hypothetical protein [Geodermatophilus bullaregiensis]MBM7804598.1 hypothetical protein [Geodermatophilus bullaregiensis]